MNSNSIKIQIVLNNYKIDLILHVSKVNKKLIICKHKCTQLNYHLTLTRKSRNFECKTRGMNAFYTRYTPEQSSKIGNTIIYFSQKISKLSKTKLLKLLYILDETSIKRSGIPMLNLKYKTWKFGPVSEDLFIELSTEGSFLKKYFKTTIVDNKPYIIAGHPFDDAEFSQNDIDLMDFVIQEFGSKTSLELISYTHRVNSPWYNSAKKNNVLELLLSEEINNTEYEIDMRELIQDDKRKLALYEDFQRYTHV